MPSIFTRIINREIPAYIIYEDDICIAILDIHPTTKGYTLVIPKQEIGHWIDMDMTQYLHCQQVAQSIAKALFGLYHPIKVGLVIEGMEVDHVHLKLIPLYESHDMRATTHLSLTPEEFTTIAQQIKTALV